MKILEEITKAAKHSETGNVVSNQGSSDVRSSLPEGDKKKELSTDVKKILDKNKKVDIVKSTKSGISGGLNADNAINKANITTEVKTPKQANTEPKGTRTSLINDQKRPSRLKVEEHLQGGLENKAGTEDVNANKVKGMVKEFGVAGGLGVAGGENIKETSHKSDKGEKEKNKVVAGTNASKVEETSKEAVKKRKEKMREGEEQEKDSSSKNGTVIGAVIGAVAGAASGSVPPGPPKTKPSEKTTNQESSSNPAQSTTTTTTTDTPSGHKEFETRPVCSEYSELGLNRRNGQVLYETDVYKRRYFFECFWTKRHFVITKDGRLMYYRNLNTIRRGEFSIEGDFSDISPEDHKGKYGHRLSLISDKEDFLGFESKEKRDEFMYWIDQVEK